jgi:hypothetical protein
MNRARPATPRRRSNTVVRTPRRSDKMKVDYWEKKEGGETKLSTQQERSYEKIIRVKDDEIETLKKNILKLNSRFLYDIDILEKKLGSLEEDLDITEGELQIFQNSEKAWIGRALKLKFILDEIKKIGALPKDHTEWVEPMVEEVDIPEVSIRIKDEFVPTAQTDNIDWTDEEEDEDDFDNRYEVLGSQNIDEPPSGFEEGWHQDYSDGSRVGYRGRTTSEEEEEEEEEEEGEEEELGIITTMNIFNVHTDRWMLCNYAFTKESLDNSAQTIQKYWRNRSDKVIK